MVDKKQSETEVMSRMEDIRKDLVNLKEDVSLLTKKVTEEGVSKLNKATTQLSEGAKDAVGKAQKMGEDATQKVEKTIEKRPIASVAVAFGAGILLSKLFDQVCKKQ